MPSTYPYRRRILPPTIRYDATRGQYFPVIPGTRWHAQGTRQYFPDEVSARIWARQTWCLRHHRKTCPPIVLDTCAVRGSLRDSRFLDRLQAEQRQRWNTQQAIPISDGSILVPTPPAAVSDSTAVPDLDAGGELFDSQTFDATIEDSRHTHATSYAGMLDDEGATPSMHPPRVVYISPRVDPKIPPIWEDGHPRYALDPTACLLWGLPADDHEGPVLFGGFPTAQAATAYAVDQLQADFVVPRISRWALSQDAQHSVLLGNPTAPVAPNRALNPRVQRWIERTTIRGVVQPFYAESSDIGVWLIPDSGEAQWWESSPGVPYRWPKAVLHTPRFQAWVKNHHFAIARSLLASV